MGDLTSRQQAILAMVVREYIRTAKPVGSQAIVEGYGLKISSATVRNEMAALEESGYLTHLHTSAGRIPTEQGYRYFVERLMEEVALSPIEQRMIRHQFYQVQRDIGEWVKLAAAVLARTTLAAAIVSPPKARRGRVKQVELIPIRGTMVLLVLIMQDGFVLQRMLGLGQNLTVEELRQMSNRLTDVMSGLDVASIRARLFTLSPLQAQFAEAVIELVEGLEGHRELALYRDGLLNILEQPEYTEAESAKQLLSILESSYLLEDLLNEAAFDSGVKIIIGGEGRWVELSNCSVVIAPYGITGEAVGSLGVLGPLRMPYGRVVSTVRYVSNVLNELVQQFYGVSN